MKKPMKKILAVILFLTMTFGNAYPAAAAEFQEEKTEQTQENTSDAAADEIGKEEESEEIKESVAEETPEEEAKETEEILGEEQETVEEADESIDEEIKDEEVKDEEVSNETSEMDRLADQNREALADGSYFVRSALNNSVVMDIAGGNTASKTNVVVHKFNKAQNQIWQVVHDEKGYITFVNQKSQKVLDVAGGKKTSGTKVWQYPSNDTPAQKWIAIKTGASYKIISAFDPNLVLDIKGGKIADNTQTQVYRSNNTKAQRFYFIPLNPNVQPCKEVIPSGYYYLTTKQNAQITLDIKGGSDANKANVQLYNANKSFAQSFKLEYQGGYYTIRNAYSNKVLDVASGGYMPGTNVWQYNGNNSAAQKWSVQKNGDGTYTFISVQNGMALDVSGGRIASGSNIQVYTSNGTDAQKFKISPSEEFYAGKYNIKSALSSTKEVEIQGGKVDNKTNVQIYNHNNTEAQKWAVLKNSDKTFSFINTKSGRALDVANGKTVNGGNVWQYNCNHTVAQKWKVYANGDGTWRIASAANANLVLGIANGKAVNGSNVNIQTWKNTKAQKWTFKKTTTSKKILMEVQIAQGLEHTIKKGGTYQLGAKEVFTNGSGGAVTWSSSNSSIVSVTSAGKVTGKRAGYAMIRAASRTDKKVYDEIRIYVSEDKGQLTKARLDSLNLKGVKKLMIVAHPDDETFWGGGHLLEDDYLVVCFTNSWNNTRKREFENAMKYSKDVGIILEYPDLSDGEKDNWNTCFKAIQKDISLLVGYKAWDMIVTHNPDGEYGHIHHKMLDKYTTEITGDKGKKDKLYYFGKFYKKGQLPGNMQTNLSAQTLKKKSSMVNIYSTRLEAYEEKWSQMQPYEYWIKATEWK